MTQHQTIPAHDLRQGDLLRIGSSTNYVLVHSAYYSLKGVEVTVYDGDQPNPNGATLFFTPYETVSLSMRDAKP